MSLTEGELSGGNLLNGIEGVLSSPIGAGVVGAVGGAIVGGLVTGAIVSKRKRRKSRTARKRSHSRRNRKGQRKPHTAGKGKDRSHKRIRYTKNNQPYIIMASGKARFISKSSARRSRKLKGGRY